MPGNESSTYYVSYSLPTNLKIYLVCLSVVAVASIVMNGLFLYALLRRRSLRCPSNTLLGVLATLDLLTGLIAMPLCITGITQIYCFQSRWLVLQIGSLVSFILIGLSELFVALISLDRYAAICHPFRYLQWASSRLFLCIAGCVCVLYTAFTFTMFFVSTKDISAIHIITLNALAAIIFGVLIFSNIKIFMVIKKQRRSIICVVAQNSDQLQQRERDKKQSYVMVFLVITFTISVLPYFIVENLLRDPKIIAMIGSYNKFISLHYWPQFPIFLNSAINPLIYYYRISYFRNAVKELIPCL